MRLTRSMTKMKKTIDHDNDGNNKKRPSSPTSLQPDVVSIDHTAKKARTQQPESPTTSDHDTPTRHSLSPIDNHSTSSHSFNDSLSPSNDHDTTTQGTLTISNQDRLSPTDIYYDEQEFSAHSQSPTYSPPPLTMVNRSDGVRYSNLNDDHPLGDDIDDDHQDYSAFGWPSMGPGEDDINQHEDSSMSDRPLQRSLLQDFLQVEDYHSNSDPTMMTAQQPTDEMDLFFSASQADYASMSFSTKLSFQQQKQELLALGRPTYITLWPHFLTLEYFDKHDAQDRADIVPSPPDSPAEQPLDDMTDSTPSSASYFDTKFSVLERIGSGEYADVWKVWNTESNEVFAIKKLKMPFQSFADRWLQLVEVRNMMMVQSAFCLNLFSAWEQDGFLYLQTDCAVATLADYLHHEESSIPETTAWKIIYEISMGLQAIHHAGVVHLDLKPSNILIDPNGTLRIGDFGTSIRRPLDVYEFKGEGDRHYMAPDLLREEYDTPADVFSLGLIIFEMMTQVQLPSTGDSWEMLRLGDFSDYKQRLGTVPLEIRRVMLMMLKSSSEDRATMDDILALPHLQRIAPTSTEQQPGALYDFVQLIQEDEQE